MAAESKLEKYCEKQVKKYKGFFLKMGFIGRNGCPDRLLWLPWMVIPIWVEFKAPDGPTRAQQILAHKKLRKMGMYVTIWLRKEQVDNFVKPPRGWRA